MAHLDIVRTAFAGFGVIRANPLALLGWAVLIFLLGIVPALYAVTAVAPVFYDLFQKGMTDGPVGIEQAMALQARMMAVNPVLMLSGLVLRALLVCAVFRAVLQPQARRFAFLRVGIAELLVIVVMICVGVFAALGAVAVMLGGGVVAAGLMAAKSQEAASIAMVVAAFIAAAAAIWVALRLSMAVPMSFSERSFRLFESWRLTRGHALGLLLVAIVVLVVIIIMEAVLGAVVGGVAIGLVLHAPPDEAAITAFFARPPQAWLSQVGPWAIAAGVVFSLVGAVFSAVAIAPWASAYSQLAVREPEAEPVPTD